MPDIDLIRSQCRACEHIVHFNNAGSSLAPDSVTAAVIEHLQLEQEIGGYEAAQRAEASIENFYRAMGKLLHCQADAIAYIENATRAWEMALYAIPFQPGDEIITFSGEYASNYMGLLHIARQKQLVLKVAPLDDCGLVDLEQLAALLNERTRLIALTHVASQRGDCQPAAAVGKLAREHGCYYLLDACQSAGQVDLDVKSLHCDFLSGTGRKYLRGPRGTGFLYVNPDRLPELEPVFVDLHAAKWTERDQFQWRQDARKFENFERFVAGVIGLGAAADYATAIGLPAIESRISELRGYLQDGLQDNKSIQILEKSSQRSGIVTLHSKRESAEQLQARLREVLINTSVATAGNARFDLANEGVDSALRVSLHYFNIEAEIDKLLMLL